MALALGERLPRRRDLLGLALIGVSSHAIYLGLSYLGMRHVPAGLTAIIVSANPVLTACLAALLLDPASECPQGCWGWRWAVGRRRLHPASPGVGRHR